MKKKNLILSIICAFTATAVTAQTRYVDPIYTNADIEVTSDVTYGTNIDFLTSKLHSSNAAQISVYCPSNIRCKE